MAAHEHRLRGRSVVAAVGAVAATYAYFLLFAEFGFLKLVTAATGGSTTARGKIMAAMGLAGLAGSLLAARIYADPRGRRLLASGFALCAVAAALALTTRTVALYPWIAGLIGLGAGVTTVTLASSLRGAVGGPRLGLVIGLGTGLAYGGCNLPAIFTASGGAQALLALGFAGAGLVATGLLDFGTRPDQAAGFDYSPPGIALWVLIFLALVGLDSAVFAVIQQTPDLRAETWSSDRQLEANAALHLVAALLAGWALDRGGLGRTVLAGSGLLLGAGFLLGPGAPSLSGGALVYVGGVSVYSTALVFYPAWGGRPGLAALVYAVAGWLGSAAGLGLAAGQQDLPGWWPSAAAAVLAPALGLRAWFGRKRRPAA